MEVLIVELCAYCKKEIKPNEIFYFKNLTLCEECFKNKKDDINANFKEIWEKRFEPVK
jgi:repressor of nif and glnA expression